SELLAEIANGGEKPKFPPHFIIDDRQYVYYLYKKWECPDKIAVEGGWGIEVWAKLLPLAPEGSAESSFHSY
ncbi:hypothetical protein, partial [Cetobacterium sp.]|uniref:hypothetical protein n=1 Tax=Cetobacterium sp. TaxID=2071632 RepID=UPI003F2DC7DA